MKGALKGCVMSVYDGAELTKAGAREWLDRFDWTLEQSVYLLCAIDPKTLNNWASVNGGKVAVGLPDELMAGVRAALLRGAKDGQISFPSIPQSVIAWVMSEGMRLPAPLIPAGCKVKDGKWTQDKPAPTGLPHFEIPVRPYEVPPKLLDLAPGTWVHYEDGPRPGIRRGSVVPAAELVDMFTALMDRQARGKFTLVEAAQTVAEHGGVDAMQLLKDMKEAAMHENEARRLKVYGWNTRRLRKPPESVSAIEDYVMAKHLNEWLDKESNGLCLPMPEQFQQGAEAARPERAQGKQSVSTQESKVERQARRYQMCIDAGLTMPDNDYSPMPRGIGEVATREGIKRQSFVEDVKAHINRMNGR